MGPESELILTSSNSFRVDHREETTSGEMSNDVKSYLYEFRLRAQKYNYDLALFQENGKWKLGDPIRHESMATKAHRSLLERKNNGQPTHREEAELAGITFLEEQLADAEIGDSIVWFSPPGPKEEDYGPYGFGFDGEIVADNQGIKDIKMTANRFEEPTLEGYRHAFRLLTGSEFNTDSADDFIRMPLVIRGGLSKEYMEAVFAETFGFVYNEEEAKRNDMIYRVNLKHLIDEYSAGYQYMSPSERRTAIHLMENIATEKKKFDTGNMIFQVPAARDLTEAMKLFNYEPERVMGSCPVPKSNSLFSKFEMPTVEDLLNADRCQACGFSKEDNHYHCPDCDKKYSDETSRSASERTKKCKCGFEFAC